MIGAGAMLSVFIREPEFQGQTKDRLATAEAQRIVEQAIKDPFDHWLAGNPTQANKLLDFVVERAEERTPPPPGKGHRAQERGAQAPPARQARRLHQRRRRRRRAVHRRGRLAPAARPSRRATARSQAILPLRGKILNVASAGKDKLAQNQQLADLVQALGCGTGIALSRRRSALRQRHHHDRRRRRRRPYRLAADHVLLPADAAADRQRPPLSRGAAALSADATAARPSMPATTSTATRS